MSTRALVLDANVLIRAVLGTRVLALITAHARRTRFCAPDAAYADAYRHLPLILSNRNLPLTALDVLRQLETTVRVVPLRDYLAHRDESQRRMRTRDIDDHRSRRSVSGQSTFALTPSAPPLR